MKHILCVTCVLLAFAAFPARASAQPTHAANGAKAEFHLSDPLVVGGETLNVGDYTFQCIHVDGHEFLVIKSVYGRKEVARVPCRPESLQQKVPQSELRTVSGPAGAKVLTAVQIKGETVAHRVVTN